MVVVEDLDDASSTKELNVPREWDIFLRAAGVADLGPIYRGPRQMSDWLPPLCQRYRTNYACNQLLEHVLYLMSLLWSYVSKMSTWIATSDYVQKLLLE